MYKLLIANYKQDEKSTFLNIISNNFENIKLIAEANNGREAISKAKDLLPDIVLMDIDIPGIKGIEVAEVIKDFNKKIKILISTSSEFYEYAMENLNKGVDDIILTPILECKVISVLESIIKKIELDNKQKQFDKAIKTNLKDMRSFIESELISSILLRIGEAQIREYFEVLGVDFTFAFGIIFSINEKDYPKEATKGVRRKIYYRRIFDKVLKRLNNIGIQYFSSIVNDCLYTLIISDSDPNEYNQKLFSLNICNSIVSGIEDWSGLHLNVGAGFTYDKIENLADSFLEARLAITQTNEVTNLVHFGDTEIKINYEKYPYHIEKILCDNIINCNEEEAMTALAKLFKWGIANQGSIDMIRQKLLEGVIMITRSVAVYRNINPALLDTTKYFEHIKKLNSIKDIEIYITELVRQLIHSVSGIRRNNINVQISKAIEYIESNYKENLTLEVVAKYVSLSPNYFSKLFKQQIGENFTDYVNMYRITMAENLLRDTDLSIKEVCAKVGYNNASSFNKLFRKYLCTSPNEYKQSLAK